MGLGGRCAPQSRLPKLPPLAWIWKLRFLLVTDSVSWLFLLCLYPVPLCPPPLLCVPSALFTVLREGTWWEPHSRRFHDPVASHTYLHLSGRLASGLWGQQGDSDGIPGLPQKAGGASLRSDKTCCMNLPWASVSPAIPLPRPLCRLCGKAQRPTGTLELCKALCSASRIASQPAGTGPGQA